ncbi:MAG: DUF1800 domain-containing protein, partial [Lysobacteraceae bacterium]
MPGQPPSLRKRITAVLLLVVGTWLPTTVAVAQPIFVDNFEARFNWPENDAEAARFLAQATFGPTLQDIAHLRQIGYSAWIDEQLAQPASRQVPYLDWVATQPAQPDGNSVTDGTRLEIWTINALGTPDPSRGLVAPRDQLRQRVAFAWSQVFVVSALNGTLIYEPWAVADWNDMLAEHAFSNYRDLLREVTLHPAMGVYLSHIQNRKQNLALNVRPDENYAREVMQLFSIGLVHLNPDGTVLDGDPATPGVQPIPTYDQATVRGFAAVFTGWNWNNTGCGVNGHVCCTAQNYGNCGPIGEASHDKLAWQLPMQPIEAFHENVGDKQLLIYPDVALPDGVLLAGGNAQQELDAALDNIFHHPNVGPFLALRLIQRLVTSNPTPAYVARVAAAFDDNGAGVRGDLAAVVRAVLLDEEARLGHLARPTIFGKLREPLIRTTHLWRAMEARSESGRIKTLEPWPPIQDWYGQGPLRSPSVFNFYRPDFSPLGLTAPDGSALIAPEFQILTDSTAVDTANRLFSLSFCWWSAPGEPYGGSCWSQGEAVLHLDTARDMALAASSIDGLIDRYDLLFLSGQMSPAMRSVLSTRLNQVGGSGNERARRRIQHALYLILNSPEYAIQK